MVSCNSATPLTAGYRADGLRAWAQAGSGAKTFFLYDGDEPVCELTYSGGSTTVAAVNTFGANGLLSRHTSGGSVFYTFDLSGNVCQRLNASAAVQSTDQYDGFGLRTSTDQHGGLLRVRRAVRVLHRRGDGAGAVRASLL